MYVYVCVLPEGELYCECINVMLIPTSLLVILRDEKGQTHHWKPVDPQQDLQPGRTPAW